MKKKVLSIVFILIITTISGQNKNYRFGITVGGAINQYNGNLGSSFFKFKEVCFGNVTSSFGMYLNKSLDLNFGVGVGHFGYCQTATDKTRIVAQELRCPGCTDQFGMGELRSLIISGSTTVKYKFANGKLLKENSKIAPYIYAGTGVNYLSDNMKRQCVNTGIHFSLNAGTGLTYHITEKFNIGYNLGIACFVSGKVYNSNEGAVNNETNDHRDKEVERIERRKDLIMQHGLSLGMNF